MVDDASLAPKRARVSGPPSPPYRALEHTLVPGGRDPGLVHLEKQEYVPRACPPRVVSSCPLCWAFLPKSLFFTIYKPPLYLALGQISVDVRTFRALSLTVCSALPAYIADCRTVVASLVCTYVGTSSQVLTVLAFSPLFLCRSLALVSLALSFSRLLVLCKNPTNAPRPALVCSLSLSPSLSPCIAACTLHPERSHLPSHPCLVPTPVLP